MPVSQNRRLLAELEAQQTGRYIDLCLVLRSLKTQGTILWAGGRWDKLDKRWSSQDPDSAKVIDLHDGQVPFAEWYATFLHDYREGLPRDCSMALAGGARRGGKTFALTLFLLATLIDVPKVKGTATRGWMVSAAHSERDEIDKYVHETILPGWATYREWPRHCYTFAHGAEALNISADDPETLKRGRSDVVLINEAQKMPSAVLTNAIGGTSDTGGIALLAANPPKRSKGEWLYDVQQDIVDGVYNGVAKYYHFDPKLNPFIDHAAKSRVDKIVRRIDPAAAVADEDGIWKRPGELAYDTFSRNHNVRPAPDLGDVTREYTKKRLGRSFEYIGGYDPNDDPHHAGTVWKVYGTIQDPILWCVDELLIKGPDGEYGEEHFVHAIQDKGYDPDSIVWIMDNSCFFQNSKHVKNGVVSFDYFKAAGYRCEMNQPPADKSKTGRGKNPDIELRVGLLNKLLYAQPAEDAKPAELSEDGQVITPAKPAKPYKPPRLYVDPECKSLIEALKNCKSKKVRHGYGAVGRHSHITDSAGYVAWWTWPRPPRKGSDGPLALLGPQRNVSFFGNNAE